jgi:hypothetical protein
MNQGGKGGGAPGAPPPFPSMSGGGAPGFGFPPMPPNFGGPPAGGQTFDTTAKAVGETCDSPLFPHPWPTILPGSASCSSAGGGRAQGPTLQTLRAVQCC